MEVTELVEIGDGLVMLEVTLDFFGVMKMRMFEGGLMSLELLLFRAKLGTTFSFWG